MEYDDNYFQTHHESHENTEAPSQNEEPKMAVVGPPKKKRKVRGPSLCNGLLRERAMGLKRPLEFDIKGNPTGENASKAGTWIGMTVRNLVPCCITEWKFVPDDLKEQLWTEVISMFIVTEEHKHDTIKQASTLWRDWKHRLTKKYYRARLKKGDFMDTPSHKYLMITDDHWREFVRQRQEEAFEKASQEARERSKKNLYPSRVGRKGMTGVLQKLGQEGITNPPRNLLWTEARKNKKGEFPHEPTRLLAEKLVELDTQVSQGQTTLGPREDVLQKAMNKKPTPGRLVTGGRAATLGSHFPTIKKNYKDPEVFRLRRELQEQKEINAQGVNLEEFMAYKAKAEEADWVKAELAAVKRQNEELMRRNEQLTAKLTDIGSQSLLAVERLDPQRTDAPYTDGELDEIKRVVARYLQSRMP